MSLVRLSVGHQILTLKRRVRLSYEVYNLTRHKPVSSSGPVCKTVHFVLTRCKSLGRDIFNMLEERTCKCGQVFRPVRKDQFTCSKHCRNYYYMQEWRKKHPGYSTNSSREWRASHPELSREYNRRKFRKQMMRKRINELMEHIDEVKFSKVEVTSLVMMTVIGKETPASVKKKEAKKVNTPAEPKVHEAKEDMVRPIVNYLPGVVDVKREDGELVSTYKYQHNVVYLLQKANGTFYWKSYVNHKFVLSSAQDFKTRMGAVADIRYCFL